MKNYAEDVLEASGDISPPGSPPLESAAAAPAEPGSHGTLKDRKASEITEFASHESVFSQEKEASSPGTRYWVLRCCMAMCEIAEISFVEF
mgnify:CR=1 FL=1